MATARDRGFHRLITTQEPFPTTTNIHTHIVGGIEVSIAGNVHLTQLEEELDKNNATYNQILLCISPELQRAIDDTDEAPIAWGILVNKYESRNASKISVIRTRYDNYHMIDGQSVSLYITTMKEMRNQLMKMGETIGDSTHAATLLRNVPESWRTVAQTIQMITNNPDIIEEKLEAHEADISAVEMSNQASTAFLSQSCPPTSTGRGYNLQWPNYSRG